MNKWMIWGFSHIFGNTPMDLWNRWGPGQSGPLWRTNRSDPRPDLTPRSVLITNVSCNTSDGFVARFIILYIFQPKPETQSTRHRPPIRSGDPRKNFVNAPTCSKKHVHSCKSTCTGRCKSVSGGTNNKSALAGRGLILCR